MRVLLDTHALLFWLFDDRRLTRNARALLADPINQVLVSAACGLEIATKHRLGKLETATELVRDIAGWVGRAGFLELPISLAHAQRAGGFGQEHRDPFDRVLAAQAELEDLPIVSRDRVFDRFGVRRLWP